MFKLLTELKWSPDGCRVETIPKGEHEDLPERAVEIAIQLSILDQSTGGPNTGQQPEQPSKKVKK